MIQPEEIVRLRERGERPSIIDVRTPAEYARLHAEGARLVPLDQLDPAAVVREQGAAAGEPLYFICQSGARAAKACEKLRSAGFDCAVCIEGGTAAWERAGLPLVRGGRNVISLERQVRIAAGALVLVGVLLGWLVHPGLFALSGLVGAGLVFAGITDTCGMGLLLARMPWNRSPCQATGSCTGSLRPGA